MFSAIGRKTVWLGEAGHICRVLSTARFDAKPPDDIHEITWQPPMSSSFHEPEHFGLLKLLGNEH